jgi:hypothetical protein
MQISGVIALLVSLVASRIINERGYRKLTSEQKLRLMDGFSNARAYSMIPVFVLVVAYFLLVSQTNLDRQYLNLGYFALLIAYVVGRTILSQRKISQLDLPVEYSRSFTISQFLSILGIAWFFFVMLAG